jgi:hypothetical protein
MPETSARQQQEGTGWSETRAAGTSVSSYISDRLNTNIPGIHWMSVFSAAIRSKGNGKIHS